MSEQGGFRGWLARVATRVGLLFYPPAFREDVGSDVVADLDRGAREFGLWWLTRNLASLGLGAGPEWRRQITDGSLRHSLSGWRRELRHGARTLMRDRAFSVPVIVILTLGISMTAAVFSVVDGVLLRPLAYQDADRIVMLWQHDRAQGIERDQVAVGNFLDWRDRASGFQGMAALEPWGLEFLTEDGPEEVGTWRVTRDFFPVLDGRPLMGRSLVAEDFDLGRAVVVVSHGFWQRRLGAEPNIIGQNIHLDDAPVEVVGVMPPEFDFPRGNSMWIPRVFSEAERQNRVANYYQVIGRLEAGATVATAEAELQRAAAQMEAENPQTNASIGVSLAVLPDLLLGPIRPGLLLLLACSGLLLAIACTNVASLVIARTNDRVAQMGMRAAMGGRRSDLVRPQIVECVLMAGVAGLLSIGILIWAVEGLTSLAPNSLPRVTDISVDFRVWMFALGAAFVVSLLVALPVSARAGRVDLARLLSGEGRRTTGSRRSRSRRELLVVGQMAMALVLVTGATLTARSVIAVASLDPGYETEGVAVVSTQVWRQYPTGDARATFVREALPRLASLPGVTSVGTTSGLPLAEREYADDASFVVEGRAGPADGQQYSAGAAVVTPSYFEAVGIPLKSGRLFESTDGSDAAPVVLINEELARRHFPNESPLEEHLTVSFAGAPISSRIIGVVGDVRHGALEQDPEPRVYVHHPQHTNGAITFVARTSIEPEALLESLKRELWAMNPSLPVASSYAFRDLRADAERERRFYSLLLTAFALAALAIASVGVYGIGAYAVARQRSSIGIMMALGASPARVARTFMARGSRMLVLGLGLGVLGALALTRFARGLLYGLSPTDPLTLAVSAGTLGVIALLAAYIPARRASRTDPSVTLRAGD